MVLPQGMQFFEELPRNYNLLSGQYRHRELFEAFSFVGRKRVMIGPRFQVPQQGG